MAGQALSVTNWNGSNLQLNDKKQVDSPPLSPPSWPASGWISGPCWPCAWSPAELSAWCQQTCALSSERVSSHLSDPPLWYSGLQSDRMRKFFILVWNVKRFLSMWFFQRDFTSLLAFCTLASMSYLSSSILSMRAWSFLQTSYGQTNTRTHISCSLIWTVTELYPKYEDMRSTYRKKQS